MKRFTAAALILALFTTLAVLGANPPASPAAPGPGAVLAMHGRLFAAINNHRTAEALEFLSEDLHMDREHGQRPCTLFLPDPGGKLRESEGRAESEALLERWIGESAVVAWRARLVSGRDDCLSGELSYAVFEFERTRATTGGQRYRQSFKSTSLVTYAKGAWRITHWHVTPVGPETQIVG